MMFNQELGLWVPDKLFTHIQWGFYFKYEVSTKATGFCRTR